jgi:hypothetical protein
MKKLLIVLAGCLLAACDYTVPLVTAPGIEIDKSLVGLWQRPNEDGKSDHLLVLPLDGNEYLVSFPSGTQESLFAKACLCRAGEKTLVQLKWFGTSEGKVPDDSRVYQFVSYAIAGEKLNVRFLNTDVVPKSAASTDELAKSIAANKDKTNLFNEVMVFTKVNN